MSTRFLKLGLTVAAIGIAAVGTASATPLELQLVSGSYSTSILGLNGSCAYTVKCTATSVAYSNAWFNSQWSISFVVAQSNSPLTTPYGLQLTSVSAECMVASCAPVTIGLSDVGFNGPVGALYTAASNTVSTSGSGKNASLNQWAYVDGNSQATYFGNNNAWASADWGKNFVSAYDLTNSSIIGKELTINGNGGTDVTGGSGAPGAYSLTLVDQLFCTGSETGSCMKDTLFNSSGGLITSAPEPGTLAIFGAGLLGCALFINRRRRASRQS